MMVLCLNAKKFYRWTKIAGTNPKPDESCETKSSEPAGAKELPSKTGPGRTARIRAFRAGPGRTSPLWFTAAGAVTSGKTMTALTQPQLPFAPVHELVTSTRQLSKSSVGEEKSVCSFCSVCFSQKIYKQTNSIILCNLSSIRTTK